MQIIKSGVLAGLKPKEIYDLELWEYNTCISAFQENQKSNISNAILAGYYTAYYMNAGKKAKNPNDLIKEMYSLKTKKQSFEAGLRDIEKMRELEQMIRNEK